MPYSCLADGFVQDYKVFSQQQLSVIEGRMKQINPELVDSVKNDSDEIKFIKYNNWMAKKFFDDYLDFFVWKIEQKSKETGREVKTEINMLGANSKDYWLDRGILDTEKCYEAGYLPKNNSRREVNKFLREQRRHICLYPDGFEEFSIEYINNEEDASLIVAIDDKIDGTHTTYSVFLNNDMTVNSSKNHEIAELAIIFSVEAFVQNYNEYHNWRNQEKQDIKDGKVQYVPKKKQKCDSFGGCIIMEIKDIEKWKSSRSPGGTVDGYTYDLFIQDDKITGKQ